MEKSKEQLSGWPSVWGLGPKPDPMDLVQVLYSCIGGGNGNPLQCSCLENPRDGKPGGLLSMGSQRVGHATEVT